MAAEPPVQVYIRVRPLIKDEAGHTMMDYKVHTDSGGGGGKVESSSSALHVKMMGKQRSINPAFAANLTAAPPRFLSQREDWKVFEGFTRVLEPESTNESVYAATAKPLILPQVVSGNRSACIFTYGHTGSGKSHTLLGYEGEDSLGIYKYAARDLFGYLEEREKASSSETSSLLPKDHYQKRVLLVRSTELYKDQARDLLTGDSCTIREDKRGVAKVRGSMVEDDVGRIEQKPLGRLCRNTEEVVACVDDACKNRRVGISTHHDQSSRSHLVLEMEVVTSELVEQRNLTNREETHLARLKWLQTERRGGRHTDKEVPKWTEEFDALKLRAEIKKYEIIVRESIHKLDAMEKGLGGTLVFCDLAGNEYARDAAGSTKEEMKEAAAINQSLLAVKEMIRSLNNNVIVNKNNDAGTNSKNKSKMHIAHRDSKLSILLRRHVQEGNGSRAVMMGHISPSQEYVRKTINTLTYCSMVGTAGTSRKKGKENTP